jgi:hypothetical protein
MDAGAWVAVVGAAISLVAMVGSGVGWLLARREKMAAADQAERATTAAETAAEHAGRAAEAAERSAWYAAAPEDRRQTEAVDAAEDSDS